jgi:hypothetical protein
MVFAMISNEKIGGLVGPLLFFPAHALVGWVFSFGGLGFLFSVKCPDGLNYVFNFPFSATKNSIMN